jgi:hypothetical protein
LNECVYLLNEIGVWCLAKSLLPFICQLDKLWIYIENKDRKQQEPGTERTEIVLDSDGNPVEVVILDDPVMQEILVLQYVSTFLREIRELCIKQFLSNKKYFSNHSMSPVNSIDSFLNKFSTPKVRSLISLLRTYNNHSHNSKLNNNNESFCCLIFVQNKQVATTLSLLLKKLSKEDSSLSFLHPNYIIGPNNLSSTHSPAAADSGTPTNPIEHSSDFLKVI